MSLLERLAFRRIDGYSVIRVVRCLDGASASLLRLRAKYSQNGIEWTLGALR